jgi:DNA-binding SARP family transcriptional activator
VLIKAHLAEGNPTEAIRQYRLFCKLAADHLGLEPSTRLRRLVETLPAAAPAPRL